MGGVAATLVSVALYAIVVLMPAPEVVVEEVIDLDRALQALDADDFAEARRLAAEIRAPQASFSDPGGPLYVLGVAIAHEADAHFDRNERKTLYNIASRYLQEARLRGFPPGREGDGLYELGRCLHAAGHSQRAVPVLSAVFDHETKHTSDAHRMLSEILMGLWPQRTDQALAHNKLVLADPKLTPQERDSALLLQSRLQFALRDLAGAKDAIAKVSDSPEVGSAVAIAKARILIAEGDQLRANDPPQVDEAKTMYSQSLALLANIAPQEASLAAAQYLFGVALQRQGDLEAAEQQMQRVRRQFRTEPEGTLAAIDLCVMQLNAKEHRQAAETLRQLLSQATRDEDYHNPWISLDDLRRFIEQTEHQFVEQKAFDAALYLAESPPTWIPAWQLCQWRAEAYSARAVDAESKAIATPEEADSLRKAARADRRSAGDQRAELAKLRIATRNYIDDLWNSSQEYLAGQDYVRAIEMIRMYLTNEVKRRRPEALISLGESQFALYRIDDAIASYQECIKANPKHPSTYRARILASQAFAEKGELAAAKTLLSDNVHHDDLSPQSIEWRDSLFLLGNLQHREGVESEAKSRELGIDEQDPLKVKAGFKELEKSHEAFLRAAADLTRAVARYPDAPQATRARFLIAESNRLASLLPRKRLRESGVEATRSTLVSQLQQSLTSATEQYDLLITRLTQSQEPVGHSLVEKQMLRNCYFAKSDCLFELGRYEDAIKAYSAATNRYQHEPEALNAYVQIARCHRLLGKPSDSRGTLEQAKVVLNRIRAEADFVRTTPYTREEWREILTWLASM